MTNHSRPLSPHLQVYRWQLTMVLSIVHRATGLVLTVALIGLVTWLVAAATGASAYGAVCGALASVPGQLLLAGVSFAFYYHLCNGLRHLAWDAGYWLEIPEVYASGWSVVAVSLGLTALTWVIALGLAGGPS